MNKIILDIRRKSGWPLIGENFLAYRDSENIIITIKANKLGLFIVRVNGTLLAASHNEDVIIDHLNQKTWRKSGIS